MPEIYEGDPVGSFDGRALPLYLAAGLLGLAAIVALATGQFVPALANAGAALAVIFAAGMIRKGIEAEEAYEKRKVARAPGTPRKLHGSLVLAIATVVVAWLGAGHGVLVAVLFGLGALGGAYLAFGLDPTKDKSTGTAFGISAAELEEALATAEAKIAEIDGVRPTLNNTELRDRLRRITAKARDVLGAIEDDPKDLRASTRFLHVYLDGARTVATQYAKTHTRVDSPELEGNFRRLLDQIEETFADQHARLLRNEVLDLDVRIEVLTKQMRDEGVG